MNSIIYVRARIPRILGNDYGRPIPSQISTRLNVLFLDYHVAFCFSRSSGTEYYEYRGR